MFKRYVTPPLLLLLIFQSSELCAQEGSQSWQGPELTVVFSILLVVLLAGIVHLWVRLRRQELQNKTMNDELLVFKETLDRAPLYILWMDKAFNIVNVNATAARTMGIEQENLLGRNLHDIEPQFSSKFCKEIESLASSSPPQIYDGRICGPTGVCYPTRDVVTLIESRGKEYLVRYGKDIAENLKLQNEVQKGEELVQQSLEAVEVANRMKSEFIANMNHEIRTPMNAIIGYSEMLATAELDSKEKRFVETIHKSGLALIGILNDIMDLSRIEAGNMKIITSTVYLDHIVKEVIDLFILQVEGKQLRLEYSVADNLPSAFVSDSKRLRQILQNLLSNAVKFTDRGLITITVSGTPSPGVEGYYDLTFTVEDTGIGIPATEQEKIFELFEQYDSSIAKRYGGVGIGLTLCGRLTAMMGGTIEFFSVKNKGSTFTVHLLSVQVAESEELMVVADPPSVFQNILATKVLVVDDMDLITDVFTDYFSESSVEILTASNGEDALKIAAEEKPGVIFMDLNLIGMGGMEVTRILRKDPATASIPVVVMTGSMLEEIDYKPLFDDFLHKPFHLETLKKIVGRYVVANAAQDTVQTEIDVATEGKLDIFKSINLCWHKELGYLLKTAMTSGSLAVAKDLGRELKKTGASTDQPDVEQIGEQLIGYAAEPNILGVEQMLSHLSSHIELERE